MEEQKENEKRYEESKKLTRDSGAWRRSRKKAIVEKKNKKLRLRVMYKIIKRRKASKWHLYIAGGGLYWNSNFDLPELWEAKPN